VADRDRESRVGDEPARGENNDEQPAVVPVTERVPLAQVFRWAVVGTAGVLVVLLVAYAFYAARGILVLVLIGLFVAVSLDPAVRWLIRRGLRRSVAVAVVVLVLVALFSLFLWSLVPPVVEQGGKLFGDLPGYLGRLSDRSRAVREIADRYHLTERLTSLVASLPGRLAGGAFGYLQRFLGTLASTLTVLVLSTYFMVDMPRLQRGLVELFPPRRRARVAEIADVVVDKVGGYMIGNILISLFAGASSLVCLELVGVPYALPLAVTVAIADLIPMIGATLGAVICVIVSVFTVGIWPRSVIVLLFFIAYQQLENYVISPRVMRNTVDLPAVAVLLAALIGGTMLGLVGAVMAIPIAASVRVVMSRMVATMHEPAPTDGPDS
jgi:predicted PurR-regulated permease PerM